MRRLLHVLLLLVPFSAHSQYKRIISLAPSLTEIIYYIGGEDLLIADTRYCDYPEAARDLPKIGGMLDVDVEKILLLKPDLVLASWSGNSRQTAETLAKLGIKVVLFREKEAADVIRNIHEMGGLLGIDTAGKEQALNKKLSLIKKYDHRPRALALVAISPLYSVSTNSFLGNALELAGFDNVLTIATPYPQISQENLVRHAPEVLILMDALTNQEKTLKKILKRQKLTCPLLYIDTDSLSRPGPRLFDAILELNGKIASIH